MYLWIIWSRKLIEWKINIFKVGFAVTIPRKKVYSGLALKGVNKNILSSVSQSPWYSGAKCEVQEQIRIILCLQWSQIHSHIIPGKLRTSHVLHTVDSEVHTIHKCILCSVSHLTGLDVHLCWHKIIVASVIMLQISHNIIRNYFPCILLNIHHIKMC
jgi:hypothetical protein